MLCAKHRDRNGEQDRHGHSLFLASSPWGKININQIITTYPHRIITCKKVHEGKGKGIIWRSSNMVTGSRLAKWGQIWRKGQGQRRCT